MDDLIKVSVSEKGDVVSARDLYILLGYDVSQWSRWYQKNITNDYFLDGIDYQTIDTMSNGNKTKDFAITIDVAKELCMLARNNKGKEARSYFIQCEKIAKDLAEINPKHSLPQTYSEALRELADKNDKIVLLEERNEKLEPRSKYFEQMIITDGLISMQETAKLLNIPDMGRNKMYEQLRKGNVIMKNSTVPYQHFVSKGYFELKEEIVVLKSDVRKVNVTTWVTQKGLAFIFKFFGLTNNN